MLYRHISLHYHPPIRLSTCFPLARWARSGPGSGRTAWDWSWRAWTSQAPTSSTTAPPATTTTTAPLRWAPGPRCGWMGAGLVAWVGVGSVARESAGVPANQEDCHVVSAHLHHLRNIFLPNTRCQAAKTYLERTFESFEGASTDELVRHSLLALQATLQVGLGNGGVGESGWWLPMR